MREISLLAEDLLAAHKGSCSLQLINAFNNKSEIWGVPFSGILHSVDWYLVTDVSGQPINPIFKGQIVQEETSAADYNQRCAVYQKSEDLNDSAWSQKSEIYYTWWILKFTSLLCLWWNVSYIREFSTILSLCGRWRKTFLTVWI